MDLKKICFNCMKEKPSVGGYCPHCGFSNEEYRPAENQLPPLTPLNGKYVLGRALGAGGFGITYIAYDTHLQVVVAIKELFLKHIAHRSQTRTISVEAKDRERFEENKKRFLQEARVLAMFNENENEGVVIVKDHFEENRTAYIVMEYLAGQTLKQKAGGQRQPLSQVRTWMDPVCHALSKIHQFGVVHLDVSPDNIMILDDGRAKLLDFGGAKHFSAPNEHDIVAFKRGYAPPEQYTENGRIGPWTDVYAAAATMYYCLTGVKPTDAMERRAGAELRKPSEMGVRLPRQTEEALLRALELRPEDRFQSMDAFRHALDVREKKKSRKPLFLGIGLLAAALAVGGALVLRSRTQQVKTDTQNEAEEAGSAAAVSQEAAGSQSGSAGDAASAETTENQSAASQSDAQAGAASQAEEETAAEEAAAGETAAAEETVAEETAEEGAAEETAAEEETAGEEAAAEAEPVVGEYMPVDLGTYIFENAADRSLIMGIDSGFGDDGTALVLKNYEDANRNRLAVTDTIDGDGWYNLQAAHTNSYIETSDSQEIGETVRQFTEMYNQGTEKWVFLYCGHDDEKDMDEVIIQNAAGSVMAPQNGTLADGTPIVLAETDTADETQKWYMRWSEKDTSEPDVTVHHEGDLVEGINGTFNISSALDGQTSMCISRDTAFYAEPTVVVFHSEWLTTEDAPFAYTVEPAGFESRYRIYPQDQAEGEHKCLEMVPETRQLVMRDESDSEYQLFRIVYVHSNTYLLQAYDDTVVGFDIGENGEYTGAAVLSRPYDAVEDSRRVTWLLMQPHEPEE